MAARRARAERRREREREKLLRLGVGAIVGGGMLLLLPVFVSNPVLRAAFGNMGGVGWVLMAGGAALLGLYRLTGDRRSSADAPASKHPTADRPPRTEPPRHPPPGDATVDDVVQRAAQSSRDDVASRPATPTAWSTAVFDVIEWRRFEAVCEGLFAQAGFETRTQSHGADGGIDIWLYSKHQPDGPVKVVQCKHWSKRQVGVAEMRALLGSMTDRKVPRGVFATTSTFTDDARRLAQDNGIQLLDRRGLLELIAQRTPAQQQELLAVATKGEFWKPTCASCGVKMTRRESGRNGQGFWGCVNFPRCRMRIN